MIFAVFDLLPLTLCINCSFFSEHVCYMLSPIRLSTVRNISTAFGTLAIRWHPQKILRRSSQGNPSGGKGKHKRGSRI